MVRMSEEQAGDTFGTRPGWRYVLWGGWNFLALAWLGVAAAATNANFARLLRNDDHVVGATTIAAGIAILTADLICRCRDAESYGWRRFTSPFAGGAFLFIPSWLMAIGIIATGILAAIGRAR